MVDKSVPRVFIGSSTEGLPFANAVFGELERQCEPLVWDQDVFAPMKGVLEQLVEVVESFDFAVLVLSPDDERSSRAGSGPVPRDNVLLELGLFLGALGRDRVFFLTPYHHDLQLPTDLLGITALHYSDRHDRNAVAAVRSACVSLRRAIGSMGRRATGAVNVAFWHGLAGRRALRKDVPALIASCTRSVFLSGIAMNYIPQHCRVQIVDALNRGVRIEIAIAADTLISKEFYHRYTSLNDPNLPLLELAYNRYRGLLDGLDSTLRQRLGVYANAIPLTHSIGIYDDTIYVSEFCIDCNSSECPSYCISPGAESYPIFIHEAKAILASATPLFGGTVSQLVNTLSD